jgi:hypothetical protein
MQDAIWSAYLRAVRDLYESIGLERGAREPLIKSHVLSVSHGICGAAHCAGNVSLRARFSELLRLNQRLPRSRQLELTHETCIKPTYITNIPEVIT